MKRAVFGKREYKINGFLTIFLKCQALLDLLRWKSLKYNENKLTFRTKMTRSANL